MICIKNDTISKGSLIFINCNNNDYDEMNKHKHYIKEIFDEFEQNIYDICGINFSIFSKNLYLNIAYINCCYNSPGKIFYLNTTDYFSAYLISYFTC